MERNGTGERDEAQVLRHVDFTKYMPLIALAVLVVTSSLSSPHFLSANNLLNILRQISYTGVIALGMTLVIISGGIDLSVGSMTAMIGGAAIVTLNHFGHGSFAIVMAILVALSVGAAAGLVNGLVVTKGNVTPFIATLGTMSVYRSITLFVADAGEFVSKNDLYPVIGGGTALGITFPVWTLLTLAAAFHVLLNDTRYGRYIYAIGGDEQTAVYSAIRVNIVKCVSYVLTGATAGVSAVLLSSRLNALSSSTGGLMYELDAIAAVVIGGTSLSGGRGTIHGTLIGCVILGIINNMLNMLGVSPYLQGTVKGLVIISAVLIQYERKSR
jgi:ribose transport system permease protein